MKLIVLLALVAVAAGARLDNLEKVYLPPDNGSQSSPGFQNPGSNFGQSPNGQTNGASQGPNGNQVSDGGSATSNQYLPPDHGPSGSTNGFGNFAGSLRPVPGFGIQGSQFTPQFGSGNRQYQTPQSNYQNPPQQAFDEETGYHY